MIWFRHSERDKNCESIDDCTSITVRIQNGLWNSWIEKYQMVT